LYCLDNKEAPQCAFVLEVAEGIARIKAVYIGIVLALDSDLIIIGSSNSNILEVLILSRMRAAIIAKHYIWLLLLDYIKEYSIYFIEFFFIFV
jgi:hypothetical protein